jgi:hypothetical protein
MRRIFFLIVFLPVVAACGGGAKNRTAGSGPAAATSSASTASDPATAGMLLLASSDFPAGWTATAHQRDASQTASDQEQAACLGISAPSATHTTVDIDSPDFSLGNAQASDRVEIVRTVGDFTTDVAAVRSAKFLPCMKNQLAKAMQDQGMSVVSATVASFTVPDYGEFSAGLRATLLLKVQGHPVSLYLDLVLLGKERVELTAAFTNASTPFDPELEHTLLARLGARLEAA